jgi:hypothetical protein
MVRLRVSVAVKVDNFKEHGIVMTSTVLVARRKIAVNTVNDIDAFSFNFDSFPHLHTAISVDGVGSRGWAVEEGRKNCSGTPIDKVPGARVRMADLRSPEQTDSE